MGRPRGGSAWIGTTPWPRRCARAANARARSSSTNERGRTASPCGSPPADPSEPTDVAHRRKRPDATAGSPRHREEELLLPGGTKLRRCAEDEGIDHRRPTGVLERPAGGLAAQTLAHLGIGERI